MSNRCTCLTDRHRPHLARLATVAFAAVLMSQGAVAQYSYSSGQNISPAYEGWERNADGSFNLLFGYMNRNWEEEIDVPIGPENSISPGPADQGQPTHFLPRRNRFTFSIRVPADFGDKEVVWTLTTKGKTERAYATLKSDYFIDEMVRASEIGALGAGISTPEMRANVKPTLTLEGPRSRTVRVGQPLTLAAVATDDGIPKTRQETLADLIRQTRGRGAPAPEGAAAQAPGGGDEAQAGRGRGQGQGGAAAFLALLGRGRGFNPQPPFQVTVGSETGLRLAWFLYRGTANVTFSPEQTKVWEDTRPGANSPWAPRWNTPPVPPEGKWVVEATFDAPGTYVLRARASDGALAVDEDVTVAVTP